MKPSIIPDGLKGKELKDFIVKNEKLIINAKKSAIKKADSVPSAHYFINEKGELAAKAFGEKPVISESATRLKLDTVINTTNYFDSYWDVHIPGLWNKSLSDNRANGFYLLNSHSYKFEAVIGEGMAGTAKKISWMELGYNYVGMTEALMFSGEIEKSRNPFMFEQYAKGFVRQHSVGMSYLKILTCINDEDYPVQQENWDKYSKQVVNLSDAEEEGIFWAVLEAKVIEGSSVLFGANDLTPTYNVEESTKNEPVIATQEQPQPKTFDVSAAIKQTIFII